MANNALERSAKRHGSSVLAMDCVLAGAECASCLAAEQVR